MQPQQPLTAYRCRAQRKNSAPPRSTEYSSAKLEDWLRLSAPRPRSENPVKSRLWSARSAPSHWQQPHRSPQGPDEPAICSKFWFPAHKGIHPEVYPGTSPAPGPPHGKRTHAEPFVGSPNELLFKISPF